MQSYVLSTKGVVRGCQFACFIAAIVLLRLAAYRLSEIAHDEAQILIGLLAAIACTLLLIVIGLLLPIAIGERANTTLPSTH